MKPAKFIPLADMRAKVLGLLLLIGSISPSYSQVDTLFWFAVPDFTNGHGDEPIFFRFTTLDEAVTINVSQPANPSFQNVSLDVDANSAATLNMTSLKGLIENDAPNRVSDKGILIKSTGYINVYYENASHFNPEIFSLKGSKSLGEDFLIPMQSLLSNGNYGPVPFASFDIVASEDSTVVSILPSHDIVGHAAGQSFEVLLNKGQTYSAWARTTVGGRHLGGSFVSSNKPIAITIKDDSMAGGPVYGGCADLGGDQITPIDYIGKSYITVPGALNSPNDAAFIYAIKDRTTVTIDGQQVAIIDKGEFTYQFSYGQPMIIEADKPVYVLHMSGFGCEVGLDQLPPVNPCNGSSILSVSRSSNQQFFLNILAYNGMQDGFLFNGRTDIITAARLSEVPGSNGQWFYGRIEITNADFPSGSSAIVRNTKGPFHLSVIHGGPGTGTMYGYFSDYGEIDLLPELEISCGDGIQLDLDTSYASYLWSTGDTTSSLMIPRSGIYSVTVTSENGCVAADTMEVEVLPEARSEHFLSLCPDDSLLLAGQWFHQGRPFGEIVIPGAASNGCDSVVEVGLTFYQEARGEEKVSLCRGDTVIIHGEEIHEGRPLSEVVLPAASRYGCDSTVVIRAEILSESFGRLSPRICPSDSFVYRGQVFDTGRSDGVVTLVGENQAGCDSIVEIKLSFYSEPRGLLELQTCPGDTLWVHGKAFHEGHDGDTVLLRNASSKGCDSLLSITLDFFTVENGYERVTLCSSDTMEIMGQYFHAGQTSAEIVLQGADKNGCDSIVSVEVEILPESFENVYDTLCPGETLIIDGEEFSELRSSGEILLPGANRFGCDSMIMVDIYFPENYLELKDTIHLKYGEVVELHPVYQNRFEFWEWSTDPTLSCDDCERPEVSPFQSTEYFLKATDRHGCVYFAQTEVIVEIVKRVFVPNAITVDGNGLNDGFTLYGNYMAEIIESLEIYDRWGELIWKREKFEFNKEDQGWDGSFRNEHMLPGVYVYKALIRFKDGETRLLTGDVTVIR